MVSTHEVKQENLIGSKWISAIGFSNKKDTIEFADMTYCIYTSIGRTELFTYIVRGNRIILGDIIMYVKKDNTLLLNGYPVFIRLNNPLSDGRLSNS